MIVGDLPAAGALQHMSRVTQSVYAALLRAHVEEQGWGDVVSSQVSMDDSSVRSRARGSLSGLEIFPASRVNAAKAAFTDANYKREQMLTRCQRALRSLSLNGTRICSYNGNQVMEAFGTLVSNVQVALGQVRGVTCLPLPPDPRVYADGCEHRQVGLSWLLCSWTGK